MLIDFIFNIHCEAQFEAFKRGFYKTMSPEVIELFQPEELELMICGSKEIDFHDLEMATRYVDGYTATSPIVSWFWEIVHNDMNDK